MRILALIVITVFSLVSLGCEVRLQPAVQGEWSNVHNDKDKISKDAKSNQEKQPDAK
jgi:hypothetical protein